MNAVIKQSRGKKYIEIIYDGELCNWGECIRKAHNELGEGYKNLPVVATTRRLKAAMESVSR